MVRRPARAAAFADAFVFPGGGLRSGDSTPDAVDGAFTGAEAFRALTDRGGEAPVGEAEALGFFRAALRELFEEAGVLLARDAHGRGVDLFQADASTWEDRRRAVQAKDLAFVDVVRAHGLTLDHRALAYFSHWITPPTEARRFDTRFFVAAMPEGQSAAHCNVETTDGAWVAPREALDRAAAGQFPLVIPTRKHLEVLAAHPTLEDLVAFARTKPIRTVQPARGPARRADEVSIGIPEGEW
jgi:8-oxo-dGTP pyrophosphatase MutT (NUDIX family)